MNPKPSERIDSAICFVSTGRHPEEAEALAELLAASYDHALLLAALADHKAVMRFKGDTFLVVIDLGDDNCERYPGLAVSPFGTPVLSPELRTALRAACGVKP